MGQLAVAGVPTAPDAAPPQANATSGNTRHALGFVAIAPE
jgi:hypothetical protein